MLRWVHVLEMKNFQSEKIRADTMRRLEPARADYWSGYLRGLRRAEFGERFGTEEEHRLWLALNTSPDRSRRERGHGYRIGLRQREQY